MHWRTYERLTARHDAFVDKSFGGMTRRFGIKVGLNLFRKIGGSKVAAKVTYLGTYGGISRLQKR